MLEGNLVNALASPAALGLMGFGLILYATVSCMRITSTQSILVLVLCAVETCAVGTPLCHRKVLTQHKQSQRTYSSVLTSTIMLVL